MKVTYYGHACFAAEVANRTLLFDPFISGNELAKAVDPKQVPADFILISHGHADHLADAADIAKRTGATIISNYEVTQWFGKMGLQRTHPLNHGGVTFSASVARNSSMRFTRAAFPTGCMAATRAALSSKVRREIFITRATPH